MSCKNKLFLGVALVAVAEIGSAGTNTVVPIAIPAVSQIGLLVLAIGVGILGARLISKLRNPQV